MTARISVIYYSSTGNVHAIAEALTEGAADAGAEVRLRRVAEHAPEEAIASNPEWRAHLDATENTPVATLDDLAWADGFAFGSPTRFGNVSSQLKQFIDSAGGLWDAGELANKPATGFTSSYEIHGGQETTLLSLYNVMHHWGCLIVPTGYVDYDLIHEAGGNPYGLSSPSCQGAPSKAVLKAARFQGERMARISALVRPLRPA